MMIIEMSLVKPSIGSNCGYYDYGHHSFCISIEWNGTMLFSFFFVFFLFFHALISYRNKLMSCISKIFEILIFFFVLVQIRTIYHMLHITSYHYYFLTEIHLYQSYLNMSYH
jgi:hypothetical protein